MPPPRLDLLPRRSSAAPAAPVAPVASSRNRLMPTLSTLPPELKALVVAFVAEIDDEEARKKAIDEDYEDVEEEVVGDATFAGATNADVAGIDDADEGKWKQPKTRSICNMVLVSVEFSMMSFPFVWKHVDFEDRSDDSIQFFIDHILPRHAQHVQSIRFRSAIEPDDGDSEDEDLEEEDRLPRQSEEWMRHPMTISSALQEREWEETLRSTLFFLLLSKLPNVRNIDADIHDEDHDRGKFKKALLTLRHLDSLYLTGSGRQQWTAAGLFKLLGSLDLRRLSLEEVDLNQMDDNTPLSLVIATMARLEFLCLAECFFVNSAFAGADWTAPLKVLILHQCEGLHFSEFITLIHRFSSSLEVLDLDGVPTIESLSDNIQCLSRQEDLPHLQTLIYSGHNPIPFLDSLDFCHLTTIQLGFCPSITCAEIESFLKHHRDRPEGERCLTNFTLMGDSHLSDAQKESLELWCFAKSIECCIEPADSDDEDDEDDDDDDFEDEDDDDEEEEFDNGRIDYGYRSDDEEGEGDEEVYWELFGPGPPEWSD